MILYLIIIFATAILLYFSIVFIISLWRGCSKSEAASIIHRFVKGTHPYHLCEDQSFISEAWNSIRVIIGDKSYSDLEELSKTIQLLFSGYASGLPYVAFTVVLDDNNTKIRLKSILCSLAEKHLTIHNMYPHVLADWKEHDILHYPVLMIRYSENDEQSKLIERVVRLNNSVISSRHQSLTDDDEGDIDE